MLELATGAGKTFIAGMLIETARERGHRVLFIVDAISLVDQTLNAFYGEGLFDLGVIQADHPMTNWAAPILIASVQTLQRQGMPRNVGLVIVDEAHCQNRWLIEVMASEEFADIPFIGLSATPWSRGLGHIWDDLIKPVTMRELIDLGFLCPFRVYASAHPDLKGVKTVGGDYHEGQLGEVMGDAALVADIVTTWRRLGEDRPTVAFCVDRAHARKVQARFVEAGIGCGYIDAYTDRIERNTIRQQLDRGEISVVANVGCLTKGVDWALGCIILARPTKSEMLFVQMVGRGLRVNEGIPDCVILDHADNTLRLGFVTDIHHAELCTAKKGERKAEARDKPEALPKECSACAFLKPPKTPDCPQCGFKPEKQSEIQEAAGELVAVTSARMKADKAEKQSWYSQLRSIQISRKYQNGWVANTYRKKFGVWPRGLAESIATPTPQVEAFVQSTLIRHAKARRAA